MKLYAVRGPVGYMRRSEGRGVLYYQRTTASKRAHQLNEAYGGGYELVELTAGEKVWEEAEVLPLLELLAVYKSYLVTLSASLADFARERMAFEKALKEKRDAGQE